MNQLYGLSEIPSTRWIRVLLLAMSWGAKLFAAVLAVLTFLTWTAAFYITHPLRAKVSSTPADFDLEYDEVFVTSADGLVLVGWYLPGRNGAAIIAQHGFHGNRESLLYEAAAVNKAGYGVLLTSSRGHDVSDRGTVTFGKDELQDLDAWYQYLLTRDDVDPRKIGILGESMGGGMAILYAARNEEIKTVVVASPFALNDESVESFIFQEAIRPGPLTPVIVQMMLFWAETNGDFRAADLDTVEAISQIAPRPVFIVHGGQDNTVSSRNGHLLLAAAQEPKEFLFFPEGGHCNFDEIAPDTYVHGLLTFLDRHLLAA